MGFCSSNIRAVFLIPVMRCGSSSLITIVGLLIIDSRCGERRARGLTAYLHH
jgi:hypothetical protein